MDRKMSNKEVSRFMELAGILKESFDSDAPQSNSYEDVIDWLDQLYPDASQYSEFLAGFKRELQRLTPEERTEWIAKFKRDFGENLNEWHPDDPSSVDIDDTEEDPDDYDDISEDADYEGETGDTTTMGNINEIGDGFKFKVGDVVNSKVSKGNKLVVLMAFPNLEAAYKYDGESEPTTWESAIVDGEIKPVSKDVADKPWYLTWTRETVGENLVMCEPEEFLFK